MRNLSTNDSTSDYNRRSFLRSAGATLLGLSALPLLAGALEGCTSESHALTVSPGCERATWKTLIVSKEEPGEPLIVSGRIYADDGKTPLEGICLYVYHTDASGHYSAQDGNGQPPVARLRAWMRTDAAGRYEFRTIKPAPYPRRTIPAHIHASAAGAGYAERWIDDFCFDGDRFITDEMRAKYAGLGSFTPIMSLTRDGAGVLHVTRDIRLQRVPERS